MIEIEQVTIATAEELCRKITIDLPEYFGLPEINENYALGVCSRRNLGAKIGDDYVGMISIDFPYPNNSNIYWMAILQKFHGRGIGKKLIEAACVLAQEEGASSMTVETLAAECADANYLKTYKFYQANGFDPLFNLKPQGYEWDMVYMVRVLVKNIQSKSYA